MSFVTGRSIPNIASAIAWCLLTVASTAQEYRPPNAPPGPSAAPMTQYVLFKSGNVIDGVVTEVDQTYRIRTANGEARMPMSDVLFVGRSLRELYEYQQSQIQAKSGIEDQVQARARVRLAQWCLKQKLPELALQELGRAKILDPGNPMIAIVEEQALYGPRRYDAYVAPTSVEPPAQGSIANAPQPASAELPSTADEAIGGENGPSVSELEAIVRDMPPGTMKHFTASVQPLLLNSCGASDCHGPGTESDFELSISPNGGMPDRLMTHRNLYETLHWIDRASPRRSPLLMAPIRPHGGADQPALTQRDLRQYLQMANWVLQVCAPRNTMSRLSEITYRNGDGRSNSLADWNGQGDGSGTRQGSSASWDFRGPGATGVDGVSSTVTTPARQLLHQQGGSLSDRGDERPNNVNAASFFRPQSGGRVDPTPEDMERIAHNPFQPAFNSPFDGSKGIQRGVPDTTYRPRDAFDPELFNRRFFPDRVAKKKQDAATAQTHVEELPPYPGEATPTP